MEVKPGFKKEDLAVWAGFSIIATSAIIVAVCLPEISQTFSTNLAEGGGLETARGLVVILVLLLAGILAQRWGKKRFLALGQYFIAGGFVLASFAPDYPLFLLAMMMTGVGGGFSEALLNPLIIDIHPRQSGRYLNLSHAFYPLSIMGSALLFGELLTWGVSWRLIFQITAAAALLIAIFTTISRFPPDKQDNTPYGQIFSSILKLGGFWLFAAAIFFGGSIEAALTFWSRTYVETYLSAVPRAGALAVVIFAAAMAAGRFLTAYLDRFLNLNSIMIGFALLGLAITALLPFAGTLTWFYALIALAGLSIACFWPSILAEAGKYLPVNKTILMVLLGAVGIVGHGTTPWIMGLIGDSSELRTGFLVLPALFVILMLILLLERWLRARLAKRAKLAETRFTAN